MQLQSLKLLYLTVLEETHLHLNTLFDLDLWIKVTQDVAQYSLHHAPNQIQSLKLLRLTVKEENPRCIYKKIC